MSRDRLDVLLLRDMPEQRLLSMERLADETVRGFAEHAEIRMRATTVRGSGVTSGSRLERIDSYIARLVRYPLAARRERADVYHVIDHGYGHLAGVLPAERTVISCHDLMLLKAEQGIAGFAPGRLALARFKWSTSWLARVAHVIAPTEATKRDLIALRGVAPERISVVPYGVDGRFAPLSAEHRTAVRASLGGGGRRLLLSVSTGDPYKNLPATLRTTSALRASGIDVALVRVGRPLEGEQRTLARSLGLSDCIIEARRVSDERLIELYGAADALLFPSFWEGYGWPPLEAMACGTPVVASNCAPLVEVVGDAALTAPARDIAALTQAVAAVLTSPELADGLRRRGIERAGQYTWSRTIAGFAAAYESIAESTGRRARRSVSCAA